MEFVSQQINLYDIWKITYLKITKWNKQNWEWNTKWDSKTERRYWKDKEINRKFEKNRCKGTI